MNIHTRKQEILQDFDRDYMQSYKGDSGLGGNDPQEPVYDFACEPKDVRDFLSTALDTLLQEVVAEVLEIVDNEPLRTGDGLPDDEIIEDSIQDAFVRQTLHQKLDHLLKEGE